MQFIALVPSGYQHGGNPVPLMVSFHGAGDNHKNFFANTQLKPVAEQNSFIYVCPKSATGNAWSVTDDGEMSAVVSLVDWFKTNYNIDTSRIYTHGFSRGGQFAPYICFKRSGVFAGFFENSGGMPGGGQVSGVCAGFCIHAQDDQAVPIGYSEDLVQKMEAAGNPVDYRWKSSGGHTVFPEFYQEAWDYLYSYPRQ
ncbi:MAG: hypothetical protein E3J72_11430 [Planctomycetota bacterium]|nr:MAG: hypothetical protein E3J72_11430 [Planctomycetota bacterium]